MINMKKSRLILALIGSFMVGFLLMGSIWGFSNSGSGNIAKSDDKLNEIQQYIDKFYLKEYDEKDLKEGIYKGYVEGLDDPYSSYMSAEEFEYWMASTTGVYSGIGVTFAENDKGQRSVLEVGKDSPAQKAGIEPGDCILKVDGKTYDDIDTMAAAIRGKKGTKVTLTILHDNEERELTMVREKIEMESVEHKVLDGNIGYIKIYSFIESTGKEFESALKKLEKKNIKCLVVDLRDNGGGLVDQCVEVADVFLDGGVVCYTEDKKGNLDSLDAEKGKTDIETVFIINENSASASEILAAAVKEKGYKVCGTTSFGKGVIQTTVSLDDGSALKLTVMQYLSPEKNVIHEKGVKPDVYVKDKAETEKDEQLEKALQILK